MHIVLVLDNSPLPFRHAVGRWYHILIRSLVARNFRVTIFIACASTQEMEETYTLFPPDRYEIRCYLFQNRSGFLGRLRSFIRPYSFVFNPELCSDLQIALTKGYDILHLETHWAGWAGWKSPQRALLNVHCLYQIDQEFLQPTTWFARLLRWTTFWNENRILRRYSHIRTLSDRLLHKVREIAPRPNVVTIPLGIDPDLYEYLPDDRRTQEPIILLTGSMGWYPSLSAATRLLEHLWPAIKQRVPHARIHIVGWNARSALRAYLGLPDVTIEENVPDIKPYFEKAAVMVYAPARGSGMKVKVLESMLLGIPVVTTSEGVEGLPATDGVHAGVCEDDAGLIDRAVGLLMDTELQNRYRLAARHLIETHCGPKPTVDALEAVYRQLLDRKP